MELFLWFVLYTAFVLPVTKIFTIEINAKKYYKFEVEDFIWFGILWPLFIISVPIGGLIEFIVLLIYKKLMCLIKG